jgi:eukaryotic-like serine/threonine-protein kinase
VTPERLREIESLFHEARERPATERDEFLARACAGDSELRREVESLLAQAPVDVIDTPMQALVAGLVTPASQLLTGRRIGVFDVRELLGVGGMGEVYRATDTRLDREVAIKILPRAFKGDPDRLARFEREARLLASLNHPHIGALYGLEDAADVTALVMELVEGEDLAQRLTRGAVPLDEALPIAKQIADALEAAHERGIIHRDLKPANIKVRADGTVKVLDFGLAKAFDPTGRPGSDPTMSPTLTIHATQAGVILGTAAYMPPEQARGKAVDKRADLWSFGCVLFEMLTGRRPFEGETISDVLAKIIERDPDWTALPAHTPQSIRTLLRRCLIKDPRRRLDSAAAARLEIDDASAAIPADGLSVSDGRQRAGWPLMAPVGAAVVAAAIAAIATWTMARPVPALPAAVSRFPITLPPAQPLAFSINDRDVALSADGARVAYTAGDQAQLMVRALDQLDAAPLAGIVNARAPFLSPDGRWIGFFDRLDEGLTTSPGVQRGALRKVSVSGGPPITICTVLGASRGASWGPDDSIVFATSDLSTGLLRVPASGGEPEVLTTPDTSHGERDHYFPFVLPGSRGVLFTMTAAGGSRQVAVLDFQTGQRKTLIRSGSEAQYVETGHLVYADGGALWAVRFDLASLSVRGDPAPILERVLTLGAADFTISRGGTLVYVPVAAGTSRSLVWVSRQGAEEPIAAPFRAYVSARLSPDGTRAAVHIVGQPGVWTWDFARGTLTPLRLGRIGNFSIWTPDGRHIIFEMARDDAANVNLYRRAADGTGTDEQLTTSARPQRPNTVSPDGTRVVFEEQTPSAGYDFMLLYLQGTPRVEPLLQTPFDERNAAISPDGRWMAYESNESGQSQVYVRPFPTVADARYQISNGGGRTPAWAPDGRDLFFVNRTSIMAVAVQLTPTFSAGNPAKLFDASSILLDGRFVGTGTQRTYDVSPDGRRFLMIKENIGSDEGRAPPSSLVVVQNWIEEVKAKVAAGK